MDKELVANIRNMAITKRLNFLVGSGTSVPAIPLMNDKSYFTREKKNANGKI